MKKILTISICILSLVLLSCGTTSEVPTNDTEEIKAPTVQESQEIAEEEVVPEVVEPIVEVLPQEEILPEIEEPEVITITPSEIEDAKEKLEKKVEEAITPIDKNNEELVELEELPPLPEIEEVIVEGLEITEEDNELGTDNVDTPEAPIIDTPVIDETSNNKMAETVIEEKKDEIVSEKEKTTTADSTEEPSIEELPPTVEEENIEVKEEDTEDEIDIIKPSRSVTVKRREYIDVSYPGTGWIYMGLTDNSKDITYFGRDLGTKDTNFSLQAKNAGTKILHFYKNDNLTGEYLDDYVEVIILDEIGSNKTHIAAPPYKQPLPEAAEEMYYKQDVSTSLTKKEDTSYSASEEDNSYNNDDGIIVIEDEDEVIEINDDSVEEVNIDTNTLLKEAQLLYNEKEYKAALEKTEEFLSYAAKKYDEGLYLKGQILEAKSEIQNIKGAIDAYSLLTKEYPASRYWNEANKRIVYLKRFYLEVR